MRKSRYVTILLAATALAACDQNAKTMTDASGQPESTIYGDVDACAKDQDAAQCNKALETAKAEHAVTAPKFASVAECEAAGFNKCEEARTLTADGTQHSTGMFMPMMMGFMMGRMLGGGGMMMPGQTPAPPPKPVYADRGGTLYANNTMVGRTTPGATSLGPSGVAARSVSRGGFGSAARGFSGGS